MSVDRSLALRHALMQQVNEAIPAGIDSEWRQDRMFALLEATVRELGDRIVEEMAGEYDEAYVIQRAASYCAEMFIPFLLAAIKEQVALPPVARA